MHEIAPSKLKTIVLTKAMYTTIRSYDEQPFETLSNIHIDVSGICSQTLFFKMAWKSKSGNRVLIGYRVLLVRKVKRITLSGRNRCGLFQIKTWLSRPKNMEASDPSEVTQEMSELVEDRLMKDIIK